MLLLGSLLTAYPVLSRDLPSDTPGKANAYKQANSNNQSSCYGSLSINPYNDSSYAKDEVFVTDTGGNLDNYLLDKTVNPIKAKPIQGSSNSQAPVKIITYETDEIIYQSPATLFQGTKTFAFSVSDTPDQFYTQVVTMDTSLISAELIAPDGSRHAVPDTNNAAASRLAKQLPAIAGQWQLVVTGDAIYKVIISRAVGDIEVYSQVMKDELAPYEITSVGAYLYDKRTNDTLNPTPIIDSELSFEVTVVYEDGSSETLELFDDGRHQDLATGDGFYANNDLSAKDQGIIRVYTTARRANHWQLQTYRPEKVTVRAATQSKITGNYQDSAIDSNNDGFKDLLAIDVEVDKPTTSEEVNQLLKAATEGELQGNWGNKERPLVSIDYRTDPRSSIVDALSTMVVNDT